MKDLSSNREIGQKGESLAVDYLKSQRYKILEQNVRSPFGEIDIVAKDKKTLVFVEVKTRRSRQYGPPEESITYAKKTKLMHLGEWYLAVHRIKGKPVRFDVLAIELFDEEKINFRLIRNALDD